MVSRCAFFVSIALLLAGQAHAAPFLVKSSGLTARSAAPLGSISAFERRIPSEIAVRAPDGVVIPFSEREEAELFRRQNNSTNSTSTAGNSTAGNSTDSTDNTPPPSVPDGNLNKNNPQNLPEEAAVTAPDGIVKALHKREGRLFGRQDNSTSSTGNSTAGNSTAGNSTAGNSTDSTDNTPPPSVPDGNLNQNNPQNLPEEAAVTSSDGTVQAYHKRAGRLFGRQDNSDNSDDNTPPPSVPNGNEDGLNPQDISDDDATSAVDGVVTSYHKRGKARRFISSEIPTRSLNGEIEVY